MCFFLVRGVIKSNEIDIIKNEKNILIIYAVKVVFRKILWYYKSVKKMY